MVAFARNAARGANVDFRIDEALLLKIARSKSPHP
jgi:hypothetical protein